MQYRYILLTLLAAVLCEIYLNAEHRRVVERFLKSPTGFWLSVQEDSERLFTLGELETFNNLENGLYLAIIGRVFDVTAGEKHYGPGATYHGFTGRDASMAFLTGEFKDDEALDDLSSLSNSQAKDVNTWVTFYSENYIYKGKLIGRYYDEYGEPTQEYIQFVTKVRLGEEAQSKEDEKKRMFPPCNVEWKADVGSRVWCTKQSGGVTRDWVGVPRKYFERPGMDNFRCACVDTESKIFKDNQGKFKEYDECLEHSTTCVIPADD